MKALVLEDVKKLTVTEVPDPTIDDDGIIIKVKANGVCRSDWHFWNGDLPITQEILGHEFVGIVEEVGKNVKRFKPGDRVIVPFSGGDGTCEYCVSGKPHLCESSFIPGMTYPGGYAEYVAVPYGDRNVVHLPEGVDFVEGAALGCRFMTSYSGITAKANVRPGEKVVVYGCGGIGLSAIHVAANIGAIVIAVDINDNNLELAKKMGAQYTINSRNTDPVETIKDLTNGGADVSVDALGIPDTCVNGILSLKKGGRHLQIGVNKMGEEGRIPLPITEMVMSEIQLITTLGMPAHHYEPMLAQVALGKLQPGKMVSGEISLSEVEKIFEDMSNFNVTGTYVVTKFE